MRAEEALAQRVERAGADVAVDDADRRQRERKEFARMGAGRRQDISNRMIDSIPALRPFSG
jgi:hypothetical protein